MGVARNRAVDRVTPASPASGYVVYTLPFYASTHKQLLPDQE
jgi:hypothetical protein